MPEPLINAERVEEILKDCLFRDEECDGETVPEDHVRVEGIVNPWAFHPGRLEGHADEIRVMLDNLPDTFKLSVGGGWSFLNACMDRNETLWTGFQRTAGALLALGEGIGYVQCQMPRELWPVLPGGVPYYVIKDGEMADV